MAKILEKDTIQQRLKEINWGYIAPNSEYILENVVFTFKNLKGKEITFHFAEIWAWLYDENYIGCIHDCDYCLTPIC